MVYKLGERTPETIWGGLAMDRRIKNEAEKTYGYWKVIKFHDIRGKNARWLCKCTNCGCKYPVYGFALRNGRSTHCKRCNGKGLD